MSIQSRIVRGIGYGAVAVSMLGFSMQAEAAPALGVGWGDWHSVAPKPKKVPASIEDLFAKEGQEKVATAGAGRRTVGPQPIEEAGQAVEAIKGVSGKESISQIILPQLYDAGEGIEIEEVKSKEVVSHGRITVGAVFDVIEQAGLTDEEETIMILLLLEEV